MPTPPPRPVAPQRWTIIVELWRALHTVQPREADADFFLSVHFPEAKDFERAEAVFRWMRDPVPPQGPRRSDLVDIMHDHLLRRGLPSRFASPVAVLRREFPGASTDQLREAAARFRDCRPQP